jgi:hypothetical protein
MGKACHREKWSNGIQILGSDLLERNDIWRFTNKVVELLGDPAGAVSYIPRDQSHLDYLPRL